MSDEELLKLAREESAWADLHALCLDRPLAEQLARALLRQQPQLAYEAAVWGNVLRELHPDLALNLPEAGDSKKDVAES